MEKETEWMKQLLPENYKCEPRENGVFCYSEIGIDENDTEHWEFVINAIRHKFKDRLMEIYHQTSTNHQSFTVYIK